jgi:hypothetical protein
LHTPPVFLRCPLSFGHYEFTLGELRIRQFSFPFSFADMPHAETHWKIERKKLPKNRAG